MVYILKNTKFNWNKKYIKQVASSLVRYQESFDFVKIHSNLKNMTVKFPVDTKLRDLFIY